MAVAPRVAIAAAMRDPAGGARSGRLALEPDHGDRDRQHARARQLPRPRPARRRGGRQPLAGRCSRSSTTGACGCRMATGSRMSRRCSSAGVRLFVLMSAVAPWRRLRNLDAVAAVSLVIAVVLFQHRYLSASVLAAGARDALPARSGARSERSARPREPPPSTPLLDCITPGLDPARRVRWLRGAAGRRRARVRDGRGELARRRRRDLRGHGGRDAADPRRPSLRTHAAGDHPRRHLSDSQLRAVHAAGAGVTRSSSVWNSVDGGLAVAVLAALVAGWAVFRTTAGPRRRFRCAPGRRGRGGRAPGGAGLARVSRRC